MNKKDIRVLLIQDKPDNAKFIRDTVAQSMDCEFRLDCVVGLNAGLMRLSKAEFDAVLLDIPSSYKQCLQTITELRAQFPQVPILLLTSLQKETLARKVVRDSGQGYLIREQLDNDLLTRAVHNAIERQQHVASLEKQMREIQSTEAHLQNVITSTTDGIVIVDGKGIIRFANPAIGTLFGRTSNELVGQPFGFPIIAGEATELEIVRPDQQAFTAEMRASEIEWEGQTVHLASLRDITEHNQAEELYRTLANSSPVGVYITYEGKFQFVNPQLQNDTGYTEDELLGTNPLSIIYPEDRERVREMAVEMLKRNRLDPYEFRTIFKSGEIKWVMETVTSIQYQGKRAVLGNIMDITKHKLVEEELRESEKRYSTLVEQSNDSIIVTRDGLLIFANSATTEMTGFAMEEMIGKRHLDFVAPEYREQVVVRNRRHIAAGKLPGKHEMELLCKDGNRITVENNVTPIVYDGKPAVMTIRRDITERKKAQQARERLSQQLQEKVDELEAFSYGIAHDLRSPLLSIEGFSRLLREDIQNQQMERVQEDIRLLESGVRKMQQFLNRTLEYSRAGYQIKPTKNISFDKIAKEVVAEFTEQLRSIGATISLTDTFPKVYADRMRIRQVLTNLIQNSINYRDETRPLKIEIGYRPSKRDAVFFVRDNGVGIDASEAEKIFTLFYRGTADGKGSGAGLAIVKKIIEAHGGRIWVESQPGKGTTMRFVLPQQSGTNKEDNNGKD